MSNENIFPPHPWDEFYKQFADPLRAYSNLPSAYAYYLENPRDTFFGIDHTDYAIRLANAELAARRARTPQKAM